MALCGFQLGGFNLGAGSALPNRARLLLKKVPGASALYMPDRKLSSRIINGVRVLKDAGDPKPEADFSPAQIANSELLTFLDGADGKTPILYDWSGNGINATQTTVAAQPFIATAGVLEEGLRFAGGQVLRSVPSNQIVAPFTVCAWAKPNPEAGLSGLSYRIYSRLGSGDSSAGWIGFAGNNLELNGSSGGAPDITTSGIVANTWYFVTGIYMPTSCQLLLNGSSVGTANVTLTGSTANPIAIGARGTTDRFFRGNIGMFGIWPKNLSLAEINTVKNLTDPTA
jgi:hypothetical protein